MNKIDLKHLASYEEDFALWAAEQAALVRAGKLDRVDLDNVAEEIESLGRSDKYQITSRLEVLIAHLLKWEFQPALRSNSWKATIIEQRMRVRRIIEDSPSLAPYPGETLAGAYIIGKNTAITDTGLSESAFPMSCPYTTEQVLDDLFYPGPASK